MKKQIVRISILQSSKITTILYFLLGFIYLLIGVPMIIFGNDQIRIMGIIYCAMPILMAVIGFVGFVIVARYIICWQNGWAEWSSRQLTFRKVSIGFEERSRQRNFRENAARENHRGPDPGLP